MARFLLAKVTASIIIQLLLLKASVADRPTASLAFDSKISKHGAVNMEGSLAGEGREEKADSQKLAERKAVSSNANGALALDSSKANSSAVDSGKATSSESSVLEVKPEVIAAHQQSVNSSEHALHALHAKHNAKHRSLMSQRNGSSTSTQGKCENICLHCKDPRNGGTGVYSIKITRSRTAGNHVKRFFKGLGKIASLGILSLFLDKLPDECSSVKVDENAHPALPEYAKDRKNMMGILKKDMAKLDDYAPYALYPALARGLCNGIHNLADWEWMEHGCLPTFN